MSWEIIEGDCLDVMRSLERVDHIITDPPYSRDVYHRMTLRCTHEGSGTLKRIGPALQKMGAGAIGSVDSLAPGCASEFARVVGRWVLVFSDVEFSHLWRTLLEDAGLRYARTGAWVKPFPMPQMSGDRPAVGFEPCTICHADTPMRWNGGGKAGVWTFNTCKGNDRPDHPCPKPLPLMRQLILDFTDPGDTILDPFCGSGTTGVACIETGRNFVGIEINPDYCRIARERCAKAERQPDMFVRALKPKQLEIGT